MNAEPSSSPTTVRELHFEITTTFAMIEDSDEPLCERWAYIITHLPEMRTRLVGGPIDDLIARGMASPLPTVVHAVYELCCLRYLFFKRMSYLGMGLPHVITYNLQWLELAAEKLRERILGTTPGYFEKKTYIHPLVPEKVSPAWLQ